MTGAADRPFSPERAAFPEASFTSLEASALPKGLVES